MSSHTFAVFSLPFNKLNLYTLKGREEEAETKGGRGEDEERRTEFFLLLKEHSCFLGMNNTSEMDQCHKPYDSLMVI